MAKKFYKRKAFKKRVNVYGRAGLQLYRDVKYLKGLINSEPHHHLVSNSNNFDYNGVIVSLCNVPQGDGDQNRTGNRVLPRYLHINLHMGGTTGLASSTAGTKIVCRMIIFKSWVDNANSAGSVTPAEILQTIGGAFAPYSHLDNDITGPRRDRNRRIEVLRNEFVTFDNVGQSWSFINDYNITMNGGNVHEHLEFVSSTTAEPNSGGIYVLFVSDNVTSTLAQFSLQSKLTFYDN